MAYLIAWLSGKKTYIIAFVGAALTLAEQLGYTPPGWALQLLGFLGLGTLRLAVAKQQ